MSMINKEVSDFSVQAYQNGEFKTCLLYTSMGGNFDYGKKFIQRIDLGAKTKITDIAGRIETFHSDSMGCNIRAVSYTHLLYNPTVAHEKAVSMKNTAIS